LENGDDDDDPSHETASTTPTLLGPTAPIGDELVSHPHSRDSTRLAHCAQPRIQGTKTLFYLSPSAGLIAPTTHHDAETWSNRPLPWHAGRCVSWSRTLPVTFPPTPDA